MHQWIIGRPLFFCGLQNLGVFTGYKMARHEMARHLVGGKKPTLIEWFDVAIEVSFQGSVVRLLVGPKRVQKPVPVTIISGGISDG